MATAGAIRKGQGSKEKEVLLSLADSNVCLLGPEQVGCAEVKGAAAWIDLAILYTIKSHKHPEGEQGHL